MVDPAQHADSRNLVESILRYIPGFRGYLEKEYRRESDDLAREHIAGKLQDCKKALDEFQRSLLDSGQIDSLPACERVRNRLDTLQAKVQGGVHGYSGFFDFVRVDTSRLDDVYQHDLAIARDVQALNEQIDQLQRNPAGNESLSDLMRQLEQLEERVGNRSDILQGLAENKT